MNCSCEASWQQRLQTEMAAPYFQELMEFVSREYAAQSVYPPPEQMFAALAAVPFDQVKVVILGQDPYHGPNQANGLAFSVNDGVRIPPSLRNIFREIQDDVGSDLPASGDLTRWTKQGVLLLNSVLTVVRKSPGSHRNKGWETFTDAVIRTLSEERQHLVFVLWGAYAQQKGHVIDRSAGHLILEAAHPSPFSAHNGFFGCRHFSQTNAFLARHGAPLIEW